MTTSFNAKKRLLNDLKELETCEGICAVNAAPLESNIFEWHVNLAPTDGPYKGTLLHLIMTFPENYPKSPPDVHLCTHIDHPNVFGTSICLDVLKPYTTTTPYEGWSTAYSTTSILLQLQTFLFAENVPQEYGGRVDRHTHWTAVRDAKNAAAKFKCDTCGHTANNPWPPLRDTTVFTTSASWPSSTLTPSSESKGAGKIWMRSPGKVSENGLVLQNHSINWADARSNIGIRPPRQSPYRTKISYRSSQFSSSKRQHVEYHVFDYKKANLPRGVYYEARILNTHGISRLGWGVKNARKLGMDQWSFGYGGTGKVSICGKFEAYGGTYGGGDTITCILDFKYRCAYWAKNGKVLDDWRPFEIPDNLWHPQCLFPALCFKGCSVEFNFGPARYPIDDSYFKDYVCVEHYLFPPKKDEMKTEVKQMVSNILYGYADWADMIDDTLSLALSYLTVQDLYRSSRVCSNWKRVIELYNLVDRLQTRCFHTRHSYEEDIIGLGVSVEYHDNRNRNRSRDNLIKNVTAQFDLLSATAFDQEEIRTGVWGQPFDFFLPLVINKAHARRAFQRMQTAICYMAKTRTFSPEDALSVISTVMNSMVVSLFLTNKAETSIKCHASEKALLGYCAFHHLLLFFASKYPQIKRRALSKVKAFLAESRNRSKSVTPDLGKFLILLTLADGIDWKDVCEDFMSEAFSRQVMWMLKGKPELGQLQNSDYGINRHRLKHTFEATSVSRGLIMFQVQFLTTVGKQPGKNTDDLLKKYNKSLGRPTSALRNGLQQSSREILQVKTWDGFFNKIQMKPPTEQQLTGKLAQAIKDSAKSGYHRQNNWKQFSSSSQSSRRGGGRGGRGRRLNWG